MITKVRPAPSPTEKQIDLLIRFNIPVPATRAEASKLISDEIEYRANKRTSSWHEWYESRDPDDPHDDFGTDWDAFDPIADYGNGGDYDPGGDYD